MKFAARGTNGDSGIHHSGEPESRKNRTPRMIAGHKSVDHGAGAGDILIGNNRGGDERVARRTGWKVFQVRATLVPGVWPAYKRR